MCEYVAQSVGVIRVEEELAAAEQSVERVVPETQSIAHHPVGDAAEDHVHTGIRIREVKTSLS